MTGVVMAALAVTAQYHPTNMFRKRIEALERQITACQAAGDRPGEMAARAQKATYLLLSLRLGAFLREITKIMLLNQGGPAQHRQSAQDMLAEGQRLARQPGGYKAAHELFFSAAALFDLSDDQAGHARARFAWATLDLEAGNPKKAREHLEKALAAAHKSGQPDLVHQVEQELRRVKELA